MTRVRSSSTWPLAPTVRPPRRRSWGTPHTASSAGGSEFPNPASTKGCQSARRRSAVTTSARQSPRGERGHEAVPRTASSSPLGAGVLVEYHEAQPAVGPVRALSVAVLRGVAPAGHALEPPAGHPGHLVEPSRQPEDSSRITSRFAPSPSTGSTSAATCSVTARCSSCFTTTAVSSPELVQPGHPPAGVLERGRRRPPGRGRRPARVGASRKVGTDPARRELRLGGDAGYDGQHPVVLLRSAVQLLRPARPNGSSARAAASRSANPAARTRALATARAASSASRASSSVATPPT